MTDAMIVRCSCGKSYRIPPSKMRKKLSCKVCGETLPAPEPLPVSAAPERESVASPQAETGRRPKPEVSAELDTRDPSELMQNVNRSILTKGLMIAVLAHVLVFGLTSFDLYRDWATYGFMLPNEIKQMKKEQAEAEEKARKAAERKAREEEEAEIRAKAEAEATEKESAASAPVQPPKPSQEKSKIEKQIQEKSFERPTEATVSLDDELGLE